MARKQQPRQREVWDTISLFHSAGRPSNTDVIKPLRKLCHYTLDKRLFDFASWHCSAADALNTDLNTCTNLCAGLLRHVIAGSRSSCFKTACLFSEAGLCVGSLCGAATFWNMLRLVPPGESLLWTSFPSICVIVAPTSSPLFGDFQSPRGNPLILLFKRLFTLREHYSEYFARNSWDEELREESSSIRIVFPTCRNICSLKEYKVMFGSSKGPG